MLDHAIESATVPVCELARLVGVGLSGRVELCVEVGVGVVV